MSKYAGGCAHVHVTIDAEPIDNHECHCNVCKSVTGQHTTHVAFFNYGDLKADHPEKMKRVPFNANNPDGPLEICLCTDCGAVLMLDDRQKRIRSASGTSTVTTRSAEPAGANCIWINFEPNERRIIAFLP